MTRKFLSAIIFLGMLTGCSVSQSAKQADKILVTSESPIFDKRFESVSLKVLTWKISGFMAIHRMTANRFR
jgi:basic membrane lipoprotein Med (substrate-binding protein (PBP1-ABC) superfamily)